MAQDNSAIDLSGCARAMLAALAQRKVSAEELLALHLDRIDRLNAGVNAVVTIDRDGAFARARAADVRRAAGQPLGRLDGLPMTVKDSIRTRGIRTVVGFEALRDHVPEVDAGVITRIVRDGANVFGKTNVPTMASDIQTYNSVFGVTRNPWSAAHAVGGSSGGSAAALAMGFTPLEIGSDIAGSLRVPAHACGVYSHKPTLDLVPEEGHIPPPPGIVGSTQLATLGPMARSADDLALLFDVLIDDAPADHPRWRAQLGAPRHATLREHRIAVWLTDPRLAADDETVALLERVGIALQRAGTHVDFKARPFSDTDVVADAYLQLVLPLLAGDATPQSIADAVARLEASRPVAAAHARRVSPAAATMEAVFAAKEVQARTTRAWARFFRDYDAVICPVMPSAIMAHMHDEASWARTVTVAGREIAYWEQALWCGALATFAFLPATARPIARATQGTPIGIQIVGPYLEDRTTIHLAGLLDEVFGGFASPPV
ncbi:amidase [Bradyrhizobium sp. U87765 SZCCT0131]|uniref:amidase family protein n=1 Tax=unclassified Bradyrhizobium TaxID=2631580 RepID=UPI001BA76D92|nr:MULTISPECIES: amidase family protein [unclassified Bradyrhizobium]MBR1220899.1 amidase [Bradyrhizobium sp. U87765 SZCCT0131]MBR1260281.1 amidase [Bradyrhizobium sp. U87765 SZCCT0134]MBR1307470.1 amidase [Bradyrhizobium sp. U87765 SZCCT0110]MBR1321424.1 amidase [Bradyrhizobium sp. U87765 SZCCT0109]MBR1349737.1 amidase [Bradyrhizobium sp. U87765 SZCCT0048]